MDANEEQTFEGFAYDITGSELPTWSLLGKVWGQSRDPDLQAPERGQELAWRRHLEGGGRARSAHSRGHLRG